MNKNILITSAGQRVSLVRIFKQSIKEKGLDCQVFTTDMHPDLSSACQVADQSFQVPNVSDATYIDCLIKLCQLNHITLIIPTIDTELLVLSQNVDLFAQHGIQVVLSENALIESCRNKKRTLDLFDQLGIHYPKHFPKKEVKFPLFIKPVAGSLSQDIHVFMTEEGLTLGDYNEDKYVFMEYFSPEIYQEYTIDAYYDKNGSLVMAVPRERIKIRAGEINKGVTRKNEVFDWVKKQLNFLEGAKGCLTIQAFLHKQSREVFGIEINPRFGGGYPLSFRAGANFANFIIEEYLENKSFVYSEAWEENTLMLRYDDEIIVRDYHG
jgi:carbamoyl-phosphate synthase large subunit